MRLTTRSLLGLSSVAAIAISATIGGTALASRGADDPAPTGTTAVRVDDRGGLTNRDLRNEPGDDRRLNGLPGSPSASATAVPSSKPSVRTPATSTARPSASSTHHSGADDSGHHGGGDDSGRRHGGHGSDD